MIYASRQPRQFIPSGTIIFLSLSRRRLRDYIARGYRAAASVNAAAHHYQHISPALPK